MLQVLAYAKYAFVLRRLKFLFWGRKIMKQEHPAFIIFWAWKAPAYHKLVKFTLHFFSKFVSRANNSKIYQPNEFPRKQGFLGPLLLKSCGGWGWFIPKTFQGLHFLFSGELIWSRDFWVICPWNKFGEKAQCACVMGIVSRLLLLMLQHFSPSLLLTLTNQDLVEK